MMSFRDWLLLREGVVKTPIPVVDQELNFSCGAAALRAVLQYFRVGPKTEEEIRILAKSNPKDGTETRNLIKVCRKFGLKTKAKHNMDPQELKDWLDQGKPVIVCLQAWGSPKHYKTKDSGHYAVAIGYDDKNVIFQDPSIHEKSRGHIPWKEFIKRWHDKDGDDAERNRWGLAIWREDKHKKRKEVVKKSKKIK
jgi:predicted double-glycine peptidase